MVRQHAAHAVGRRTDLDEHLESLAKLAAQPEHAPPHAFDIPHISLVHADWKNVFERSEI